MKEQALQIARRLETMGLLMAENYEIETAQIAITWPEHWAYGTWKWVLVLNPMGVDTPESFAGSPWTVEECLTAPVWDVVDHISDSTIVPFVLKEKKNVA